MRIKKITIGFLIMVNIFAVSEYSICGEPNSQSENTYSLAAITMSLLSGSVLI